jgi:nitroreductase
MEFQQVLQHRRMVRAFTDQPVTPQALQRILTNAHRAPSAGFSQGYALLVLDQPADTARFWRALRAQLWVAGSARSAPVVIVPLANKHAYLQRYAEPDKAGLGLDTEAGWPVPYWYIDAGFAALLMLLAAVDEGLGAVLFGIGATTTAAVRAAFGVPGVYEPIGALAIGHPAPQALAQHIRRPRQPLEVIVHRGHWSSDGQP